MKTGLYAALVCAALASPAGAITLQPGQFADFEVDFSALGDFEFRRWGYACNDAVLCASGAEGQLAGGSTITLSVGSTLGGSQFRTASYTSNPSINSDAISVPLLGTTIIPASIQTVFVRIGAVDDAFTVNSVILSEGFSGRSAVGGGGTLVPVPLTSALGFAVLGIGALAGIRKRRA